MDEDIEQKYELLVDNLLDIIVELDLNGNFIFISPQSVDITGYHHDEIIGASIYQCIHPNDLSILKNAIEDTKIDGNHISLEFRIKHKNGNYIYLSAKGRSVDIDGKQKIILLVSELSKNKGELKESEKILNKIIDQTFIGFAILQDFEVKFLNPKFSEVIGYSYEEIMNWNSKEVFKIIHPQDREEFISLAQEVYLGNNDALNSFQFRVITKYGEQIWLEIQTKPINYKGNKADLIFLQDITAKKEAEQKLKESEEQSRNLISNLTDIILKINLKGVVTYVSPQTYDIMGYQPSELIGKNCFNYICSEDWLKIAEAMKNAVKTKDILSVEYRLLHKNGNKITASGHGRYTNFNGNEGFIVTIRDITVHKEIEDKLKESEEIFRTIAEHSFMGIIIFLDNAISYANQSILDLFGYSLDEVKSWKPLEFLKLFPPKDREIITGQLRKQQDRYDQSIHNYQVQFIKKNGETGWLDLFSCPIKYKSKLGSMVSVINITERKIAEQQLKESEEKYKSMINSLDISFFRVSLDGTILNHNPKYSELLGKDPSESLVGKKTFELWDDLGEREKFIRELKNSGYVKDYIVHAKKITGEKIILQGNAHLIRNNNGIPLASEGTMIDITDKYLLEQKLKESEEKYRLITEHANDLIDVLDERFRYEYINEETHKRVLGYSEKDMIGKFAGKFVHPDDTENIIEKLREGFEKGIGMTECRIKKKDGTYIWYESKGNVFLDKHGNKKALIMSRDITERRLALSKQKEASEKLKESEERYRLISEHTNDLINIIDEKFRYEYINEETHKRVLGYSKEDMIGKFAAMNVHPDDMEDIVEKLKEGFTKGIGMTESRIKKKDGTYIWYESKGNTFIDKQGNKKALIMSRDITERKIAEQKLKESEEKFRHLFEKSPFSIILFDSEGIIKDCNSVTEEMFGFKKEDFLGKNYFHNPLINSDHLLITKKIFEQLKEGESLLPQELKIFRADGTSIWINSQISKVKISNQTYFYSIIQDITTKKILEDIMFELNQNFFNYTSDFQENIQSLTQTAKKLSKGTLVLYAKKVFNEDGSTIQIITSENEVINCDFTDFKQKYFINEIFKLKHETPKIFPNLKKNDYPMDPFIQIYGLNGAYGRLIKNLDEFTSIIAIFHENLPEISYEEQLVLLLISDAIAIEEKRWQLLEKLEEQNTKLSEIDKLKSEFLRRISHELKTPLISIKGYSQLLLYNNKGILDNDTLSMIEEITRGCVRLENLISELIESSKLESAQVKLKLTFEDLSLLINNSVKELQGVAKSRNQEIILNIHEKLITKFEKERMHEVVGNLLTNAIKYSPPSNSIVIKSEIKDGFYVISVKDNGIGFTPGEKQKLFNQFGKIDRFDQETNLAAEGSGLGLYITKKLVELHGGKIWVESEGRNKGSTFYFTLPIIKD